MSRGAHIGAALLAGLLVAGPAGAQSFNRADRDRDGRVSLGEARRTIPQLGEADFRRSDLDGDGALDRGEYSALLSVYDVMDG